MDENQNHSESSAPEAANQVEQQPSAAPESVSYSDSPAEAKKGSVWAYAIAALIVVGILIGVFVSQNGQTTDSTGVDPDKVVATVNGEDVVGAELTTSISQITATAQLQGIDTTDPSVQDEIQAQAVEMLINTELLEQEAQARGVEVTDQDVANRIAALVQEIGSQEALEERMAALGIDQDALERDVKSELMIQELLDQVFAAEEISVSEEEILSLYETATGGGEDAPAIEELRPQLEAQLNASKEQAIVDEFISTLRTNAEVEIPE